MKVLGLFLLLGSTLSAEVPDLFTSKLVEGVCEDSANDNTYKIESKDPKQHYGMLAELVVDSKERSFRVYVATYLPGKYSVHFRSEEGASSSTTEFDSSDRETELQFSATIDQKWITCNAKFVLPEAE